MVCVCVSEKARMERPSLSLSSEMMMPSLGLSLLEMMMPSLGLSLLGMKR